MLHNIILLGMRLKDIHTEILVCLLLNHVSSRIKSHMDTRLIIRDRSIAWYNVSYIFATSSLEDRGLKAIKYVPCSCSKYKSMHCVVLYDFYMFFGLLRQYSKT